mmetsp:Transcript_23137/g.33901  ORF Transcript_23137/g.33901 Transcript_23137/m.33901 type:complete len:655 (-) Transcript_23137:198-2162(-)|eukprot:CAMPEP_0185034788 /NCGR_PEP_ID=MMETSP1103-20130426/24958_1 /TAXON_ID=36769 /ORGANISM="Paraphysomonas bandaiensis, Strain Caron Lab Isolate" /LENGTH=654 /DNA_ID=CAMNT_0027571575 /DNA_START=52 /DNA_END=2016 /DNA_ORIENTATION=-
MRRRDKPLDIYKKLQIVRAIEELIYDEETGLATERVKTVDVDTFKAPVVQKKKLNIPIGDVSYDADYDTQVPSDFSVPQNYVRYTKKIGDDEDITVDYCLESEDMVWLKEHPKLNADTELKNHLTSSAFERIINIFERSTGFGDPIDQCTAERLVCQFLQWRPQIANKLVVEVYQRWLWKRSRIQKPLCRRYWPQTSATDTNPHLVFRPREKEKYKLRKHRKNDLQSFRKLQSLRKEFGKARVLLQLVLERELLKQAELRVQEEIFHQRLRDLGCTTIEPKPFRYSLRFDHLVMKEQSTVSSGEAESAGDGLKLTLKLKGSSDTATTGAGDSTTAATPAVQPSGARKRKSEGGRSRKRDRASAASTSAAAAAQEGREASAASATPAQDSVPWRPCLPQCPWPSFMEPLSTREEVVVPQSMGRYMEDLELQHDRGRIARFRCRGRVGRGGRIVMDRIPVYSSDCESPEAGDSVCTNSLSSRFRDPAILARSRTGNPCNAVEYMYPTQLSDVNAQLRMQKIAEALGYGSLSEGGQLSSSRSGTVSGYGTPCAFPVGLGDLHSAESMQALTQYLNPTQHQAVLGLGSLMSGTAMLAPPESDAVSSLVTPEELDIYRMSDSEDEVVEVIRDPNRRGPDALMGDRYVANKSVVRYTLRA